MTPAEELLTKKITQDFKFIKATGHDDPEQLARLAMQRVLIEGWKPSYFLVTDYQELFERALEDITLLRSQLQEFACQNQP